MKDAITGEEYFTLKDALILFGKTFLILTLITGTIFWILSWFGVL